MVFERAKGLVRKVTLELVYEVVDERTKEIIQRIEELERKREEDFKYLNQKIDTQTGQLRGEIGQLRNEIKRLDEKIDNQTAQLRQEINLFRQEVKEEVNQLRQEMTQINHRIDTVIQMLSEILRR